MARNEHFDNADVEELNDPGGVTHSSQMASYAETTYASDPKYIVYNDDGTYKARNTETASVDFTGSDPHPVLSSVESNGLTSGRTRKETIALRGKFTFNTGYEAQDNYIHFDCMDAYLEAAGDNNVLGIYGDYQSITGGVFDGTNQPDGNNAYLIGVGGGNYPMVENAYLKNAGYYAINSYEANYGLYNNIVCEKPYRHGLHFGSDTAGRGKHNTVTNFLIRNTVNHLAVSDRGSSVSDEATGNLYSNVQIINDDNTGNGGGFSSGSDASGPVDNILVNVQVWNSGRRGFSLEGSHLVANCSSINSSSSGIYAEDDQTSSPYMFFSNCHTSRTGGPNGWRVNEVNATIIGGQCEKNFSGSTANGEIIKIKDLQGFDGSKVDSTVNYWFNGYAATNLGGSAPSSTTYDVGMLVEDRDNPGSLYFMSPLGALQVSTSAA